MTLKEEVEVTQRGYQFLMSAPAHAVDEKLNLLFKRITDTFLQHRGSASEPLDSFVDELAYAVAAMADPDGDSDESVTMQLYRATLLAVSFHSRGGKVEEDVLETKSRDIAQLARSGEYLFVKGNDVTRGLLTGLLLYVGGAEDTGFLEAYGACESALRHLQH